MRFHHNGPNIPDSLLDQRDKGRVVFLCGAGVSIKAGMPTFIGLTEHVIDFFDPPEDSQISEAFKPWRENYEGPKVPLDQIFNLLYDEYGRDDVNTTVAEFLWEKDTNTTQSNEHQIISRISSDQEGNPQVVTTNFDRLFEPPLSANTLPIHVPPAFPDINLGITLHGITYLHGRLEEVNKDQHSYILSSADLGRAYLSEGWATNFIRKLLKNNIVVLVGYQAEDPPLKYLLQGLNHDGMSDRSRLFAFDIGEYESIEAKWRDRGVTPIAYNEHADLWQSLEAWANRADDPRKWRSSVMNLATKSPRELQPYQRGQVAHLIKTIPGAKLFSSMEPSPPAEWLCVFDSFCRTQNEAADFSKKEYFDPFKAWGLDEDYPPNPGDKHSRETNEHFFNWRHGDTTPVAGHNLDNRQYAGFEELPKRLYHLQHWIENCIDSPITAWWALRKNTLHPSLLHRLKHKVNDSKDLHPDARLTWNLIFEQHFDDRNFNHDISWYRLASRIKQEGWNYSVIQDYKKVSYPRLHFNTPTGLSKYKPTFKDWGEFNTQELYSHEVEFIERHSAQVEVPDAFLEKIFRIEESNFQQVIELLDFTNSGYYKSSDCYPNRDQEGKNIGEFEEFEVLLNLFSRMVTHAPNKLKLYAKSWSFESPLFFANLKLFAFNHSALFSATEVVETLLSISQEKFWSPEIKRELLFLIHDRWSEFSKKERSLILYRIFNGPDQRENWVEEDYIEFKNRAICLYVGWLTFQGIELDTPQVEKMSILKKLLHKWYDQWAENLLKTNGITSGFVKADDSSASIINLPINQIVEKSNKESSRNFDTFIDKRPFIGLVKERPLKALTALCLEAKKQNFPAHLWSNLLENWPNNTSSSSLRFLISKLSALPPVLCREMNDTISRWLEKFFLITYSFDQDLAWNIFDNLWDKLALDDNLKSFLGQSTVGGIPTSTSRRTMGHAINSPTGHIVQGLLSALGSLNLGKQAGIPSEFRSRLEGLLIAPGEGKDHTACILTKNISWLYIIDSKWTLKHIAPWFNIESNMSEPAWNGYLSRATILPVELGTRIKPELIKFFPNVYEWGWEKRDILIAAKIIVRLAIARTDKDDGLTLKEARNCLRKMNDDNRRDAIYELMNIGNNKRYGWLEYVIPFITNAWPRERVYRTSNLSLAWLRLLEASGDNLPAVLKTVSRFIVPITEDLHWLYSYGQEKGDKASLIVQYPSEILELLTLTIPNNSTTLPYNLKEVLVQIKESNSSMAQDHRYIRLINLFEEC